eukprot:gene325-11139_t
MAMPDADPMAPSPAALKLLDIPRAFADLVADAVFDKYALARYPTKPAVAGAFRPTPWVG